MKPLYSAAQMAEADRHTIEDIGVPGRQLMEAAGSAVTRAILAMQPRPDQVAVLCGPGNNGGDGYVIARQLHLCGTRQVICVAPVEPVTDDARWMRALAMRVGVHCIQHTDDEPIPDLVVDALFGTGLQRPLQGDMASIVDWANRAPQRIAVDMPSGVCSDSGRILGTAVRAQRTLSFQRALRGHYLQPGADCVGQLEIIPIGIDARAVPPRIPLAVALEEWPLRLGPRSEGGHKGHFGHLFGIGGATGMGGALRFALRAAQRTGVGLATALTSETSLRQLQTSEPDIMGMSLPESAHRAVEQICEDPRPSALLIGPGGGRTSWMRDLVIGLLQDESRPLVLDADALYCEDAPCRTALHQALAQSEAPLVLCPHMGEFARLCDIPVDEAEFQRLELGPEFARQWNATLILKSTRTLVCPPDGRRLLLDAPNSALAQGGSGDVLAGICAGLLAQGQSPEQAALNAVGLQALAGAELRRTHGTRAGRVQDLDCALSRVIFHQESQAQ